MMVEPCGNCLDTYWRETARAYTCTRCCRPARECVRCVEVHVGLVAKLGPRAPVETCALCSLERELRDDTLS